MVVGGSTVGRGSTLKVGRSTLMVGGGSTVGRGSTLKGGRGSTLMVGGGSLMLMGGGSTLHDTDGFNGRGPQGPPQLPWKRDYMII